MKTEESVDNFTLIQAVQNTVRVGFKTHMESKRMPTVSHINKCLHFLLSISVSSVPGTVEGIQLVPY